MSMQIKILKKNLKTQRVNLPGSTINISKYSLQIKCIFSNKNIAVTGTYIPVAMPIH